MARKQHVPTGAPAWIVTFADLLAAVLAFFVMLAAYSTMDKQKLQVVAGSMREAFGTQLESRFTGIIEVDGIPTRPQLQNARLRPIEDAADATTPNEYRKRAEGLNFAERDHAYALAATTLRQALKDLPEVLELSKNVSIEETREGVAINLMDQDGRSMFEPGSAQINANMARILAAVAPVLRRMPNRIAISGHTASIRPGERVDWSPWGLSMARAGMVRENLARAGLPDGRFSAVTGKADTDPLMPDDPYLAPNRRVSIVLLFEAPPVPRGIRP